MATKSSSHHDFICMMGIIPYVNLGKDKGYCFMFGGAITVPSFFDRQEDKELYFFFEEDCFNAIETTKCDNTGGNGGGTV